MISEKKKVSIKKNVNLTYLSPQKKSLFSVFFLNIGFAMLCYAQLGKRLPSVNWPSQKLRNVQSEVSW